MKIALLDHQDRYLCHERFDGATDPIDQSDLLYAEARHRASNAQYDLMPTMLRLVCEGVWLAKGVSIHVPSCELIEDLMDTDIDSLLCEIHLPYPVMEISVPMGMAIPGTGFNVASMLIIDMDALHTLDKRLVGFKDSHMAGKVMVAYHMRPAGDNRPSNRLIWGNTCYEKKGTVAYNSVREEVFSTVQTQDQEQETAKQVSQYQIRLAIALMLYFQTSEQRATLLEPVDRVEGRWQGFTREMREHDRKTVSHYRVVDITPKEARPSHDQIHATTRNGVTGHWRKKHMRVLRHEKYARNADGSLKTLWVRWTWVGEESVNRVVGQRAMMAHESHAA